MTYYSEDPLVRADASPLLTEISKHKGIAINYPSPSESDLSEDLVLENIPGQNYINVKPGEPVRFKVKSKDFGGSGKVSATFLMTRGPDEGKKIIARYGPSKQKIVSIPLDANTNGVADAWEGNKSILSRNLSKDWDEEAVTGQTAKGDGFTLFDEYRGVVITDSTGIRRREQLNPNMKDLFIYDPDELGRKYFGEGERNAAKVNAIYLTNPHDMNGVPTEDGGWSSELERRWMNFNSPSPKQHAMNLYLEKRDASIFHPGETSIAGVAEEIGMHARYTRVYESNTSALHYILSASGVESFEEMNSEEYRSAMKDLSEAMKQNITIHEIGHTLGSLHHYNHLHSTASGQSGKNTMIERGEKNCAMRYFSSEDMEITRERYRRLKATPPRDTSDLSFDITKTYQYGTIAGEPGNGNSLSCFEAINVKSSNLITQ